MLILLRVTFDDMPMFMVQDEVKESTTEGGTDVTSSEELQEHDTVASTQPSLEVTQVEDDVHDDDNVSASSTADKLEVCIVLTICVLLFSFLINFLCRLLLLI